MFTETLKLFVNKSRKLYYVFVFSNVTIFTQACTETITRTTNASDHYRNSNAQILQRILLLLLFINGMEYKIHYDYCSCFIYLPTTVLRQRMNTPSTSWEYRPPRLVAYLTPANFCHIIIVNCNIQCQSTDSV